MNAMSESLSCLCLCLLPSNVPQNCPTQWHKRNIFQRGQSHFSCFFSWCENMLFPYKNYPFGRPQTILVISKSDKQKIFTPFPLPFSISHTPLSFPILLFFPSPCSLSSLPLFSWWVSKNFLVKNVKGAFCPLPPACYATD